MWLTKIRKSKRQKQPVKKKCLYCDGDGYVYEEFGCWRCDECFGYGYTYALFDELKIGDVYKIE